jgi:hypothetical protein
MWHTLIIFTLLADFGMEFLVLFDLVLLDSQDHPVTLRRLRFLRDPTRVEAGLRQTTNLSGSLSRLNGSGPLRHVVKTSLKQEEFLDLDPNPSRIVIVFPIT